MSNFVPSEEPVAAVAFAALVTACASTPSVVIREGDDSLTVAAQTWIGKPDPFAAPGPLRSPDTLHGAHCTLHNDKGSWAVVTPANVTVQRSWSPLIVDCFLDGYKPVHEERSCLSEHEREHERQKVEGPFAAAMLPLAVVAAPVAPQVAIEAAGRAAFWGASAAAGELRTSGKPEHCTYGNILPNMWPR